MKHYLLLYASHHQKRWMKTCTKSGPLRSESNVESQTVRVQNGKHHDIFFPQIFVQTRSHWKNAHPSYRFCCFSVSCSLLHLDCSGALFRRPPLYFGSTLAACWWPLSKPPKIPRPKWKSGSHVHCQAAFHLEKNLHQPTITICLQMHLLCVSLWWSHFWKSKSSVQATNIHFKSTDLQVLIEVDAILDVRDSHLAEREAGANLPDRLLPTTGPWRQPCAWK